MGLFIILLLIFIDVALAIVSGWVALKIGRSFGFWFFISLVCPVIALCVLICLPDLPKPIEPVIEEVPVHKARIIYLVREDDIILN